MCFFRGNCFSSDDIGIEEEERDEEPYGDQGGDRDDDEDEEEDGTMRFQPNFRDILAYDFFYFIPLRLMCLIDPRVSAICNSSVFFLERQEINLKLFGSRVFHCMQFDFYSFGFIFIMFQVIF